MSLVIRNAILKKSLGFAMENAFQKMIHVMENVRKKANGRVMAYVSTTNSLAMKRATMTLWTKRILTIMVTMLTYKFIATKRKAAQS